MTGLKVILATSVLAYLVASWSNPVETEIKKIKRKEIVFDDGFKTTNLGEIIFDGRDTEEKGKLVFLSFPSIQEVPKIVESSQLTTMTDGFGNKTITRNFYNDPLINFVILKESVKGQKRVFVYGHNGEVKLLAPTLAEKVLKTSAEEIAKLAGITEGRKREITPSEIVDSDPNLLPDNTSIQIEIPTTIITKQSDVTSETNNPNQKEVQLPVISKTPEPKTTEKNESQPKVEKPSDSSNKVELPARLKIDLGTMRKPPQN